MTIKSKNEINTEGKNALNEIHNSLNNVYNQNEIQKNKELNIIVTLLSYEYKINNKKDESQMNNYVKQVQMNLKEAIYYEVLIIRSCNCCYDMIKQLSSFSTLEQYVNNKIMNISISYKTSNQVMN